MPWIVGGAILGGSIYSAERAKDASDKQIAFQSQSSDTAVQRRTKDLRAAGINPILAAGQAATAMPGAQPQRFADPASAVQGFQEAKLNRENVKVLKNTADLRRWEAEDAWNRSKISDFERRVVDAMRFNFREDGVKTMANQRLEAAKQQSTASQLERSLDEDAGGLFRTLRRLGVTGGTAAQILRSVR